MNERLADALSYISEKHIAEAGNARRSRKKALFRTIAAVLAVVLLFNLPFIPGRVNAKVVSEGSDSRAMERPDYDKYRDKDQFREDLAAYSDYNDAQEAAVELANADLAGFFGDSTLLYMEGATDNRVWSPVNGFIALSMLAEVTGGNSRQQILSALNATDIGALRGRVEALWEDVYYDGGHELCYLANSLWLDAGLDYNQETMDSLAHYHYADIFQTDLQKEKAGKALRTWLNNNTGGLLKDYTKNSGFSPEAVLTLASTIYLQATWNDEFNPANNTYGLFHGPGGDRGTTFMNKKLAQMNYYWGDSFGAVNLGLKNRTQMWFFLPDEGKTVDDILREGQYLDYLTGNTENSKYMKVNLSVPSFDIQSGSDLAEMLQKLGITDIFQFGTADFTAITSDTPIVITGVNQAARVIIDEQGVKAAAYIEIPGAGAAAPPEEIIDFILDRPFLFVISTYNGTPLFVGVVNEP